MTPVAQVGASIEGVIWEGVQADAALGWWVALLGDVSDNNHDDIGLGAPFASPSTNTGAGVVYVIEGEASVDVRRVARHQQRGSGGVR